jgi:iron complex outermembrane recepter protein
MGSSKIGGRPMRRLTGSSNAGEKNSRLLAVPLTCVLAGLPIASGTALADPTATPAGGTQSTADATQVPQLQEIVVTAQKRSQDIEKVAVAITAITGTALQQAGVTSATGLTQLVPGLEVSYNNANTTFAIRGISSSTDATLGDSSVAFEMDGIYEGRPSAASGLFYDINRVEVLEGPQGTLYGRNAAAGVVNVITNKPDLGATSAESQVEVGDYGLVRTLGVVNAPVGSSFAVRAAFQSERHNGYLNSGYNDADDIAGRIQALYQPSDNFSFLLGADYFHQGGIGRGIVYLPLHSDPWEVSLPLYPRASTANPSLPLGYASPPGWTNDYSWMVHADLNWNLGPFVLTNIAAFHYLRTNYFAYFNYADSVQDERDKEPSDELRISSEPDSKAKWVAGLYYHNETQPYQQQFYDNVGPTACGDGDPDPNCQYLGQGSSLLFAYPKITNPSYAAFGQLTFPVTDTIRLTGGLRYNHDRKTVVGTTYRVYGSDTQVGPFIHPAGSSQATVQTNVDATWTHVDWKAGAEWDVTPNTLAYANVSTGYKQGGVFAGAAPNTYLPETLTAYSIGAKNRLFDRRALLNVDAFYYDYKNYQVDQLEQLPTNTGGSAYGDKIFNAPKAEEYGLEASLQVAVTRHDQFSAALAFLHARFITFPFPEQGSPPQGPPRPPQQVVFESLNGYPAAHAPDYTASLAWMHTWSMPNDASVSLLAQTHISSYQWLTVDHEYLSKQSGYTMSTVNLSYETASGRASYSVYVRNLESAAVENNYAWDGVVGDSPSVGLDPPRTYGAMVTLKF